MVKVPPFEQLVQDPIFIVGAARSGTTWVFDILTAHPNVAGVYESWLFTSNNGLGSLFTPAHWPPKKSGLGNLVKREYLIAHVRDLLTSIMGNVLKPEHHFLVEKSPSHLFAMPLISEIFPDARFIHVLRDGRDVNVSVRVASRSWVPSWRETFGRSVKTSARAWKDAVRRARCDGEKQGERFFEIRYEEIHGDPFSAYRRLFDFCCIPYDQDILQAVFDSTDFEKNFKSKESGFRRGGRIGDWRMQFSLKDALVFNMTAGRMLIETGYENNHMWLPHLLGGHKTP